MNFLEAKYTMLAGGRCRNFKRVSDTVYNFSCPLCGDSQKHPRKARGYITSKGGTVWYTCHKCAASLPFHRFLEAVDPSMYSEYQKERVVTGLWRRNPVRLPINQDGKDTDETSAPHVYERGDPLSALLRVDTLPPEHRARVLCEKRKIPDLRKLYHCPRFYAWSNYVLKREKFSKKALYYDHARLVIPFFQMGQMTAFQGRDYDPNSDNKYVTIVVDENAPRIYGLDALNDFEKVYAFEGPIDSMFVPNSIAFAGGSHRDVQEDAVIVYDNEPRSAHTVKKIGQAIKDGYQVCIWPPHVVQKDVNDMVLAGLDPKSIIDSRTFSGLAAEVELCFWRK